MENKNPQKGINLKGWINMPLTNGFMTIAKEIHSIKNLPDVVKYLTKDSGYTMTEIIARQSEDKESDPQNDSSKYTNICVRFFKKLDGKDYWHGIIINFDVDDRGNTVEIRKMIDTTTVKRPIEFNLSIEKYSMGEHGMSEHVIAVILNTILSGVSNFTNTNIRYATVSRNDIVFYHHDDYENVILVDKSEQV